MSAGREGAIDLRGAPVAASLMGAVAERSRVLRDRGVVPQLTVVRVGDDPSDAAYLRGIERRAGQGAVDVRLVELVRDVPGAVVEGVLADLSRDPTVHGILLLRPLPDQLLASRLFDAVDPAKDVDGMTEANLGRVFCANPTGVAPATARAVLKLLDHYGFDVAGRRVCVIGRSLVAGRPLQALLTNRDATVTLCHSKTPQLAELTRSAELVVACLGRAGSVVPAMVAPGAWVVDVGINEGPDGALRGDVDPAVGRVAGALTPVPGGVGAVTTAVLMLQTVEAAERQSR